MELKNKWATIVAHRAWPAKPRSWLIVLRGLNFVWFPVEKDVCNCAFESWLGRRKKSRDKMIHWLYFEGVMTTRHGLLLSIVTMLLSSSANATIKSFAGLATLMGWNNTLSPDVNLLISLPALFTEKWYYFIGLVSDVTITLYDRYYISYCFQLYVKS